MTNESTSTLEGALAALEQDVETTLRVAGGAVRVIKALRKAAQEGDVQKLNATMAAATQAIHALDQQFASAKEGWSFDVDDHLSSGAFGKELVRVATETGVRIFEQDDRLYCYPSLIRILPGKQSVKIDKAQKRTLRPSVLVAHLKENQGRPPRFRAEAFLELLHKAYEYLNSPQKGALVRSGGVAKLVDVYRLLTLLPGQSKEYGRAEFARDIYLLDRSGVTRTKSGAVASLHLDRGSTSDSISVITEAGEHKLYLGISFTKAQ